MIADSDGSPGRRTEATIVGVGRKTGEKVRASTGPIGTVQRVKHLDPKTGCVGTVAIFLHIIGNLKA